MSEGPTGLCPYCHGEIGVDVARCPLCGADLLAWQRLPYGERLLLALTHPISEARMAAIIALGQRRETRAALPLAQCALTHPCDVVQGLEIVRALARLPADATRTQALQQLAAHPAHAVAAAAAKLLAKVPQP